MPPQINFSKEQILNEAFEIVRQEGLSALSARRIAQRLKCSTHPIYRAFQSMKELEGAVIRKIKEYAVQYVLQRDESDEPFLSIGLQYFRFAQEEKELFKLMYMSTNRELEPERLGESPFFPLVDRMKEDSHLKDLDETQLKRILFNMRIFTHGLATLVCTGALNSSEEFIRDCLYQMGGTIIGWEHYRKRVGEEEIDKQWRELGIDEVTRRIRITGIEYKQG